MLERILKGREKGEKPETAAPGTHQDYYSTVGVYGLKSCYDPGPGSASIDIVLVHGLTGNRETTWTDKATGVFWAEMLLPRDLPNARILTYGYDADIVHFWSMASQSRIGNHAQTLVNALAPMRERTGTQNRPLIFVAHSLGGLVVEDMLLISRNSAEEHFKRILECTRGVAFLGTPHCGSSMASWASVFSGLANVLKKSNTDLLGVLRPESEVLARLQQDFHTMLRDRADSGKPALKITCFFEDLPVRGVGEIVPKHSAILPAYTSVAIRANHMDMPKFSSAQDPGYQAISNELWRWARDLDRPQAASPFTSDAYNVYSSPPPSVASATMHPPAPDYHPWQPQWSSPEEQRRMEQPHSMHYPQTHAYHPRQPEWPSAEEQRRFEQPHPMH